MPLLDKLVVEVNRWGSAVSLPTGHAFQIAFPPLSWDILYVEGVAPVRPRLP